jgi:PAS domain S-box-containing protein
MHPLTRNQQIAYDLCIIASSIAAIAITYICISNGIYEVFPYFYLIPIILTAYSRPKMCIYGTVALGWIYFMLVFLIGIPDTRLLTLATVWFYIFVSLGVLFSTYSQYYRKERQKACGAYYFSQAGVFSYEKSTLRILEVNRRFSDMVRYPCNRIMSMSLPDIIPNPEEREGFFGKIRDQKWVGDIEVRFTRADGGDLWTLVSAADCGDPFIICTVVDINAHKQAQNALTLANRKLNLLNNVTRHDILNQLTALLGYLQLSYDVVKDPHVLDYIKKEEQAAEAIKSQILFTRDYQNIGIHAPEWQNIQASISLAMATIDLRKVRVSIDPVPVEIYADPLLEKVFYNLIENSLRHGEHVQEIRIHSVEDGNGFDLILEDDGVGISSDSKEKIFRREYYRNTGFGLFLSREILAITGLTIVETGAQGKGARFVIHAPKGTYRHIS